MALIGGFESRRHGLKLVVEVCIILTTYFLAQNLAVSLDPNRGPLFETKYQVVLLYTKLRRTVIKQSTGRCSLPKPNP